MFLVARAWNPRERDHFELISRVILTPKEQTKVEWVGDVLLVELPDDKDVIAEFSRRIPDAHILKDVHHAARVAAALGQETRTKPVSAAKAIRAR